MGKIKRLLDRFDEMGRYPIQELGYSRTWLMFSYLGAFLVHRCTIADYPVRHAGYPPQEPPDRLRRL